MLDLSSELFLDPKIDYPTYHSDLPFADYITKWKKIIKETRKDLNTNTADKIIEANAPFELKPPSGRQPSTGVLLIHGLFDSPLQLHDVGKALQKDELLVRAIVLPGHGTVPGSLLNVNYQQWLAILRYGIASLKKEVEHVYIVGYSTGASLALYQMAQSHANVSGIILISPALRLRSWFVPFANMLRTLGRAWKRALWFHLDPNETIDYAKYRSIPCNAVYQVNALLKEIKQTQPKTKPDCPLLFILSEDDKTVCAESIIRYFHRHTHPESRLLLYTNKTTKYDDQRIVTRRSAYPELKILNFSHTCLPIAPSNPHYGQQGDYRYASRIGETHNTVYGEFLRDDVDLNRFMKQIGLTSITKQRLTFNPDFEHMAEFIKNFIHQS